MKELVTALTAAHAVAGALDEKGVSQAVKLYVNGTPNASPLWPAFGFTSEAEGRQFFQGSVATYARSPLDEWSLLLFQRVGVANIPDKVLASKLLRGTAELGVNMRSVIAQLSIVGHDAG